MKKTVRLSCIGLTKKYNEIKVTPPTKKLYHEAKKHRILAALGAKKSERATDRSKN